MNDSEPPSNQINGRACWKICYWFQIRVSQTLKDQNSKHQEFGVGKGLLIEKLSIKRFRMLAVSEIHFKKVQSSDFFYVKEGKMRGVVFVNTKAPGRISLVIACLKQELLD